MRTRQILLFVLLGLVAVGAWSRTVQATILARPDVFASPINASCTLVTPADCRIHVDPFTIQIDSGQRLKAFQLHANGSLIYDFRTDVSNPPLGNYTPSSVKLDFAAACGQTYTLNLLAQDSGDSGFLNAGQAENVVCPAAVATATATATATLTPAPTSNSLPTHTPTVTPPAHRLYLPFLH